MVMKSKSVIGQKTLVSTTKTRPANTTAYTADDVVSEDASTGTTWTFSAAVPTNGGSGTIVGAVLLDDENGVTQVMTLHLFNTTPTGVLNDNVANTSPVAADADNYLGRIDFPALTDHGSGFSVARAQWGGAEGLPLPFVCAAGDAALYGVLVTAGYTPTSGEIFRVNLIIDRD